MDSSSDQIRETLSPSIIAKGTIEWIHRSLFSKEYYSFKLIENSKVGASQFLALTPEETYRIETEILEESSPVQIVVRWEKQTLLHKLKRVISI